MENSIQLPFHVPKFATTQGAAAPGLAMDNHPTAYNEMLNECTTLCCNRRFLQGHTEFPIHVAQMGVSCFSCLQKYTVSLRYTSKYYSEIIKQMLHEGYYVYYTRADDFYLPGKSWYGTRHMHHDGVICGYDDSDGTYSIAAYDINWVFSLIRIPQDCFAEGVKSSLQAQNYGDLLAYKMKETTVSLNPPLILKNLKEHLNNTLSVFPSDKEGRVTGVAVYDYIAMYLEKLQDGSIPSDKMDWRMVRPVWEFSRCMYDRLHAIEQYYGWDNSFSSEYQALVSLADRVRMMYAVYHKNRREALLVGIKNGILLFKEKEVDILSRFVNKMEEIQ